MFVAIVVGFYSIPIGQSPPAAVDSVQPNPTGLSAQDNKSDTYTDDSQSNAVSTDTSTEPAKSAPNEKAATRSENSSIDMTAGRNGELRTDNVLKMPLIWCEPHSFLAGSPTDEPRRRANEGPVEVELTEGYWLGQYEVTQEQWESLMNSQPSAFSASGRGWDRVRDMDTRQLPVESITWEEAMSFCERLTEVERKAGRLAPGWKYTLPTEPQWENACRAGSSTATAFGDQLSSRQANFNGYEPYNGAEYGPSLGRAVRVGSYEPNAWGFYDIQGNVWEHCHNWYSDPPIGGTDPSGPQTGTLRVSRGGSWWGGGWNSRCSFRYWFEPDKNDWGVGFRVALCKGT